MKPVIVYHKDCTDGFAAAFAAWLKFGGEAEYLPLQYGTEQQTSIQSFIAACGGINGREIYILDFSLKTREMMDFVIKKAKRVVWLDHHKSAFEMWKGSELVIHYHEEYSSKRYIALDSAKSGALLAWEYFHPDIEAPTLIRHIDDRDRWQFQMPYTKEVHAFLASRKPWSFEQWRDEFIVACAGKLDLPFEATARYSQMANDGAAILRAQNQHVADMVKQARRCKLSYWIPKPEADDAYAAEHAEASGLAVNTPMHISEVGHELANASGTFGLVWYLGADNKVKLAFRSNGDYDVSAIAKALGGGGHRNAAGAETDIDTLMWWLR